MASTMQNFILFSLSALSQIIFCAVIFYSSKGDADTNKNKLRLKFYLLGIAIAFWCGCQYAYSVSLSIPYQKNVLKIGVIATVWVAYFFLLFAREVMKKRVKRQYKYAELFLAVSATLLSLLFNIAQVSVQNKEVIYQYNTFLYTYTTLVPIIYILEGVVSLEKFAHRNKKTKQAVAKQSRFISRGMILTTILAFSGNYVFLLLDLDTTIIATLAVALAPALYTIIVGYAVFSLKLFNFRKFFIRVVVYGGFFTLIYGLFAIVTSLLAGQIPNISNLYFSLLIFPTTLITYPLSRIITARLLSEVGKNPKSDEAQATRIIQDILREINTDTLMEGLAGAIRKQFISDSIVIGIITHERGNSVKAVVQPSSDLNLDMLEKLIRDESNKQIIDEATLAGHSFNDYQLAITMKRGEMKGVILIGQKTDGRPFYDDERLSLISLATQSALALENSLQYYKIQRFNEDLEQKITDATRELRKTNEKLKALDEAKDEFISMASHQLRTPLTSVKGYVSMVLDGDAGKVAGQQRELLEQAFASSQRMVYLIADLLNVSRLKTGKFVIESVPTKLGEVVETEMAQLKETAKAHNLELTYEKPEDFPVLNLDETKTRQVIMNFIDNAIYYTPAGGHIRVELTASDKTIDYKVIDDGLGVPRAEQHHLFTKFYRAGNAKKARPDGTGLGLFMAKKVVIAQGGSIIFESQEGKGSTFGFSFPRAALEVKK
jgi:signal transduction histidine kinase